MAKQSRTTLKGYFETGDIPSQAQYADLIDSNLNLSENNTANIQLTGNITASGDISASLSVHGSEGRFSERTLTNQINSFTTGQTLAIGDSINVNGAITASGNISASGNIIANHITASGNISVGDGTSTLPAISFGSETNTGIYKPAPGNLSLQVGGGTVELNLGSTTAQLSTNLYLSSGTNGHITASGNISSSSGTGSFGSLKVDGSSVDFSGLPTSDPGVTGRLYNDSGTIKISL